MAGVGLSKNSVRKYQNGKSGLLSGMPYIPPLTSELVINEDTTATQVVDWIHLLSKNMGGSAVKVVIGEKIDEVCRAKKSFHVKQYLTLESAGVVINEATQTEDLVDWLMKIPKWDDYYILAVDGMDAFINIKR